MFNNTTHLIVDDDKEGGSNIKRFIVQPSGSQFYLIKQHSFPSFRSTDNF